MNTQLVARHLRHQSWMEDYARQQESGLTVRAWCEQNGMLPKTFYYRLRVIREEACSLMKLETPSGKPEESHEFVKVNLPKDGPGNGIRIKLPSAEITISSGSNTEHVKMVLEAMAHA